MQLSDSELILNPDGSIYHLQLLPEDLAPIVITVGDPERVAQVSQHFDSIEVQKQSREFATHTGYLGKKRITVLSTGIGTDNIDIVLNELDALVNIDFSTRTVKADKTSLSLIRIGTSGALVPDLPVDTFLLSTSAIGMDGLMHFYDSEALQNNSLNNAFVDHMAWTGQKIQPYTFDADPMLKSSFEKNRIRFGVTITNAGFYAPQGRKLRGKLQFDQFIDQVSKFAHKDQRITNLEMETAGIYGLARLLGHKAVSLNALLANRITGEFSKNPAKTIDELIQFSLTQIATHC
ncbi:MAG: phosphorylase [Allomuricauda sp.]|nr:MAG: phosphorylase [Allomuricauda sp.]